MNTRLEAKRLPKTPPTRTTTIGQKFKDNSRYAGTMNHADRQTQIERLADENKQLALKCDIGYAQNNWMATNALMAEALEDLNGFGGGRSALFELLRQKRLLRFDAGLGGAVREPF
jgi:hypothetical protein